MKWFNTWAFREIGGSKKISKEILMMNTIKIIKRCEYIQIKCGPLTFI